jgi:hypothetical protein
VGYQGGLGTWSYDGSGWTQLSTWTPSALEAWGERLAASYPQGPGVYLYSSGSWGTAFIYESEVMEAMSGPLAASLSGGLGLYLHDGTTATQIAVLNAEGLTGVDLSGGESLMMGPTGLEAATSEETVSKEVTGTRPLPPKEPRSLQKPPPKSREGVLPPRSASPPPPPPAEVKEGSPDGPREPGRRGGR